MTKAEQVLAYAAIEVGTVESPANSNRTKYGKWFGLDGVAWCGIFVSWCYARAAKPLPKIGFTKGYAGCQTAVAYFTKNKQIVTSPQPGDIVFFDWNADRRYDHTGIFVRKINANYFETIEGNTGIDNNSNGGKVMRRKRSFGKGVLFVHPKVLDK